MLRANLASIVVLSLLALACSDAESAVGVGDPSDPPQAEEQEEFVYIWTRDATGQGTDFIAVVDADPESETFGEIVNTAPTGGTGSEAHHFGYTADRSRIMAGGMFSNELFLYDLDDPAAPTLARTVDLDPTGFEGPHTPLAVSDGVLLAMMGAADGGSGSVLELSDDGEVRRTYHAPENGGHAIHLYDVALNPDGDKVFASSFAHADEFMGGVPDPAHTGNEVVIWDRESGETLQVEELDLSTMVLRWLHDADAGFVPSGFGGTVWYWEGNAQGLYDFEQVLELPEGSFPVDIVISPDDRYMYMTTWAEGQLRQYDISDPRAPTLVDQAELPQPNMMRLSEDGSRLYVTNSLLSTLDGDVPFGAWLFHVGEDGLEHDPAFAPDFENFAAGRAGPHDMLLR